MQLRKYSSWVGPARAGRARARRGRHVARVAGVVRVGQHRARGWPSCQRNQSGCSWTSFASRATCGTIEVEHDLEAVLARRRDEPADEVGRALVPLPAHERVQLEGVGDGVDAARGAGRPEGVDVDPVEPHAGDAWQVLPPRVDRPRQQRVQVVDARRCCSHWTDRDCTPTRPELDRSPDRASGEGNGTRHPRFRPAPAGGSPCPSSAKSRSSPTSTRRTSTAAPACTSSISARALAKLHRTVEVRCFGDQDEPSGNPAVRGYPHWDEAKRGTDPRFAGAVDAFARSLAMAGHARRATSSTATPGTPTWPAAWSSSSPGVPLRADDPLARAAPAVEGRAARHRLPRQLLGRADRDRERRRRRSPSRSDDARTSCGSTASRPEQVRVIHNGIDLDQYRPTPDPAVLARYGIDPDAAVRPLRRPDHAAEGDHPPGRRDPGRSTPASRSCSAPARPTRPRSAGRWTEAVARARAPSGRA